MNKECWDSFVSYLKARIEKEFDYCRGLEITPVLMNDSVSILCSYDSRIDQVLHRVSQQLVENDDEEIREMLSEFFPDALNCIDGMALVGWFQHYFASYTSISIKFDVKDKAYRCEIYLDVDGTNHGGILISSYYSSDDKMYDDAARSLCGSYMVSEFCKCAGRMMENLFHLCVLDMALQHNAEEDEWGLNLKWK